MSINNVTYQTASFRGVEFQIRSDGHEGGHRLISHMFFASDDHENENIGRLPERHNIRGYVHAPNLQVKRRALKEALDNKKPGTLYIPFYNEDLQVSVANWAISPTKERDGVFEFQATFVLEGNSERAPRRTQTPLARLPFATEAMENSSVSDFERSFTLNGAQGFTSQNVVTDWINALDYIIATASVNYVAGIGAVVRDLKALKNRVVDGQHGRALQAGLSALADVYDLVNGERGAVVFSRIVNMGLTTTAGTSTQATIQRNNTEALEALVNRLALAHFAGFAINTDYDNQNQAHARRGEFADAVLAEQDRSSQRVDTNSYVAATELLALTGSEFTDLTDLLKPLAVDNDAMGQTSLSLAYKYYRDPSRSDELMERNFILNGSFMPSSVYYVTT